ncbi:MAG: hypothetical protein Q9225_001449 [Loekoesia sp. 1 TL-2023]
MTSTTPSPQGRTDRRHEHSLPKQQTFELLYFCRVACARRQPYQQMQYWQVANGSVSKQHHPHPHPPGSLPPHLQQSRPSSIVHQQHPNSPHQPPGAFPPSNPSHHGLPLLHQPSYHQAGPGANGHPSEVPYYSQPSPYGTPVSTQFSSSEPSDLMAATQMQRPYQSVYHTPQSNSPASVASSQSHDPNARIYGQPPPQMQQPMYAYPQYQPSINQNYSAAYAQPSNQQQQQPQPQPPQQHPSMNPRPQMMMPHQQQQPQQQQPPPMPHPQTQSQSSSMATNSPRMKFEPQAIQQRPLDPSSLPQRPPSGPTSANHTAPSGPQTNGHLHPGQGGGSGGSGGANGVNPNAAPGPIPATTPLVVRQDENGVQWILFEYSRDRVKMEYTIRCDVESVNVDQLAQEFKTENCVYPRACCNKDAYRGNRLAYETECNTVGWALAELNPCLRGKRGLIQRAVDSWRNSNQDPRLRSRRVRRMAKINTRKQVQAPHPSHLAGPGAPGAPTGVPPSTNPMTAPVQRPPPPNNVNMGSSLHHHHAHPDGSAPGIKDEVSADGTYTPQRQHQALPKQPSPNDIHQAHVFHGYPNFPSQAAQNSVSLAPSLHDGIDGPLPAHPNVHPASSSSAIAASAPIITKIDDISHDNSKEHRAPSAASTDVYGDLPEAKRRKFIIVDDIDRNNQRVRVRAMLDHVDMAEIPDSYRKTNSVYPRSYYPIQMPSPKRRPSRGNRFFQDEEEGGGSKRGEGQGEEEAVMGKTIVPVPMLEGTEGEVAVPKIGRAKRRREEMVNDLGYRMSWTQSRVFNERTMFLQRALDTYRNKMRTTVTAGGQQVSVVAPHLETRIGKRKWQERKGRAKMKEEADPS